MRCFFIVFVKIFCLLAFVNSYAYSIPVRDTSKPNNIIGRIDQLNSQTEQMIRLDQSVARIYARQALGQISDLNYPQGLAAIYQNLGSINYYEDNYLKSIEYLEKACDLYKTIGNNAALAKATLLLAHSYHLSGNCNKALELCHQSLSLWPENINMIGYSNCYNYMGYIHLCQKNYELAQKYFENSLEIKERIHDENGIGTVLTNMGTLHYNKGDTAKAEVFFKEAYRISMDKGDLRQMANICNSMGEFYRKKGDYYNARNSYNETLDIYEKLNEKLGCSQVHLNLAKLSFNTSRMEQSEKEAWLAIEIAESLNVKPLLSEAYLLLSDIYVRKEDFKQAFLYRKQYEDIHESLFLIESKRQLDEMELKYQTEQMNQEIRLLESKNELINQKGIILTISVLALSVLLILGFIFYRMKNRNLKQKNQLLEKERTIEAQNAELVVKERKILQDQLELKNKELASKALAILRTNETLQHLAEKIQNINKKISDNEKAPAKELFALIHEIEVQLKTNTWNEFDTAFKKVNNEFYDRLLEACPNLSPTEIKIAALLRLNLSTKEIEAITFKSESGIKSARHRLRKKLGLEGEDKLNAYLMKL